jgi:hypothetical protein
MSSLQRQFRYNRDISVTVAYQASPSRTNKPAGAVMLKKLRTIEGAKWV